MSYVRNTFVYKGPATVQVMTQLEDNIVAVSQNRIVGGQVFVIGTSTSKINGGSIELDGAWYTRAAAQNIAVTSTTDWITGTVAEADSTAIYVYAINSATTTWDPKYSLSAPAYSDTNSGTATGPKIYDFITGLGAWARCIGMVVNNTASDFVEQRQEGSLMIYNSTKTVVGAPGVGGLSATFQDVNLTNASGTRLVPPWCRVAKVRFVKDTGAASTGTIREKDRTEEFSFGMIEDNADPFDVPIDTAQTFEAKSSVTDAVEIQVYGYHNGAIRGI